MQKKDGKVTALKMLKDMAGDYLPKLPKLTDMSSESAFAWWFCKIQYSTYVNNQ